MSVSEHHTNDKGAERRGAMAAWAIFLALFTFCSTVGQPSPDLWWQLSGGRQIVEGRASMSADQTSFTASQRSWLNHEWLAESAMYLAHTWLGGQAALHVARIALLALAFWLASRAARAAGCTEAAAALGASLALLASQWRFFFDVRPYLFTYVGLSLTLCVTARWLVSGRAAPPWSLVPVYALWANLHSGVMAGLVLLGLCALGALLVRRERAVALLSLLLACTTACLLNPYGVEVLTFPFEFVGKATVWSMGLNEWARTDLLGSQWPSGVYLALALVCAMWVRRALGPSLLCAVVGFGCLMVTAWRHVPLFALVSVPAVGLGLQRAGRGFGGDTLPGWLRRSVTTGVSLVALFAVGWRLSGVNLGELSGEARYFPVDAVGFLRANALPERMYNAYGWGGYLGWHLSPRHRVFMDGRANTLYPPEVYRDFLEIDAAVSGWREKLDRYGVDLVILNGLERSGGLRAAISSDDAWALLYADGLAEIFIRKKPATLPILWSSARGGVSLPFSAGLEMARRALSEGHTQEARARLQRIVPRDDRERARWCALQALVVARSGSPQEAETLLWRALQLDPTLPEAHFNLGALLWARGDRSGARQQLEAEIRVNPAFVQAQEMLRQVEP